MYAVVLKVMAHTGFSIISMTFTSSRFSQAMSPFN